METKRIKWILISSLIFLFNCSACAAQSQQQRNPFFAPQDQQSNYIRSGSQRLQRQFQQRPNQLIQQRDQLYNLQPQQQQQQQQQPRSFFNNDNCPERNGRFAVPSQCDAYVECIDGIAKQQLCPEGLLFNPEARFNYPCGYPIDVDCQGRSALQPALPTEECPHQYGYFKVGDRTNCGRFRNCVDGVSHVFDCPEGLAYNPDTYRCDWPDEVADCDAEAYLGFTCPTIPQDSILVPVARFYRSPHNCQQYYICGENNRPRLQNCGIGNAFNEITGACDAAVNVTGCEPQDSDKNSFESVRINDRIENNLRSLRPQRQFFNRQQQLVSHNLEQNFKSQPNNFRTNVQNQNPFLFTRAF